MNSTHKYYLLVASLLLFSSAFAQEIAEKTEKETWKHIKLSYAKGFKSYGFQDFGLKDQNFTSVIAAEVNVYEQHGIYAEFINQPLMSITPSRGPLQLDYFFYSSNFDAYIRSRGFNIG